MNIKTTAEKIRSLYKSKEKTKNDLEELYKEFKEEKPQLFDMENDPNEFKDLGSNEVLEQLSEVIFDLSKDEISKVIKSPLAYHIIILTNIISE